MDFFDYRELDIIINRLKYLLFNYSPLDNTTNY